MADHAPQTTEPAEARDALVKQAIERAEHVWRRNSHGTGVREAVIAALYVVHDWNRDRVPDERLELHDVLYALEHGNV